MRKKVIIISMILAGTLLCGCGSKKETTETVTNYETATEQESTTEQGTATDQDATTDQDTTTEEAEVQTPSEPFKYKHDPKDNPEAMKDIVENPKAVYGFSPNPDSDRLKEYADYDWTDPKLVAQAKETRKAYHDSMESMTDILYKMRDEGASIEEMARAVSKERNRLRLEAEKDNPEELEKLKQSNLETYGHEDGPTPDEMYEKYGSWETVIQKAFSPNMGMDACCGLYDDYYDLYIELGLVPSTESKTEGDSMINPWIDLNAEQAEKSMTHPFTVPEGATDVRWQTFVSNTPSETEVIFLQLLFTMDDARFCARVYEGVFEEKDISGMYFEWTSTEEDKLSGWEDNPCKVSSYAKDSGDPNSQDAKLVEWYDSKNNIMYSLSATGEDLSGLDIVAVADMLSSK